MTSRRRCAPSSHDVAANLRDITRRHFPHDVAAARRDLTRRPLRCDDGVVIAVTVAARRTGPGRRCRRPGRRVASAAHRSGIDLARQRWRQSRHRGAAVVSLRQDGRWKRPTFQESLPEHFPYL